MEIKGISYFVIGFLLSIWVLSRWPARKYLQILPLAFSYIALALIALSEGGSITIDFGAFWKPIIGTLVFWVPAALTVVAQAKEQGQKK